MAFKTPVLSKFTKVENNNWIILDCSYKTTTTRNDHKRLQTTNKRSQTTRKPPQTIINHQQTTIKYYKRPQITSKWLQTTYKKNTNGHPCISNQTS